MNEKCSCVAVPKRYLMMALVIIGVQVVIWQTVSYTAYCVKWKDYFPYQQKEPFVYSHLVGLLLSLLPASLVSVSYGANRVFGASLLTLSVLLEVAPLAIHLGIHGLAGAQFLNGAAEGFLVTSLYGVLADWTPVDERTTTFAILTSTTLLGGRCMFEAIEFEFVTSPVIFANVALGLAWFVLWYLLFFDDPYHNKSVTEAERLRITEGNGRAFSPSSQAHCVPWRQILRSTPVHLVCLCVAAGMAEQRLGKYNYLMYLGGVTSFPALSSVLALAAAVVTSGVVSDLLRDKGWLSTTGSRRLTCTGGLIIHACATMLQGLKENHWIEHIAMTALGVFVVGIETSHVDMAPRHAPVIKALSATTLEVVLGGINLFVIADASSLTGHRLAHVFIPVAQVVAALLYFLYGRADVQPWDEPEEQSPRQEQRDGCENCDDACNTQKKDCDDGGAPQPQCSQRNIEEAV
ncbi:vesicular glutamate transporter 3-like [Dermacentor andersoni]|uniref:vesicular glutamate transporter 3-like n=1 Tax=Dermacentor andersoni TaxID=34620 RepID=UPI002416926B|nr:vesicular glutamate transporter 3-like [Dermacentor andersoni]